MIWSEEVISINIDRYRYRYGRDAAHLKMKKINDKNYIYIYMEGSKWRRGINIEMRRQLNGKTSPPEKWETVKLNAASLHNLKISPRSLSQMGI